LPPHGELAGAALVGVGRDFGDSFAEVLEPVVVARAEELGTGGIEDGLTQAGLEGASEDFHDVLADGHLLRGRGVGAAQQRCPT
jgi:hypothetical protein